MHLAFQTPGRFLESRRCIIPRGAASVRVPRCRALIPLKALLIGAAVFATSLCTAARAQDPRLAELRESVSELSSAARALPPWLRSERILNASAWLERNANTSRPADISEEYVTALRRAAEVLRRRPARQAVDDVTSELEAKVEHCRRLGVGMGGSVLVKVHTRRGPLTVPNVQVRYLLKFYEWVKGSQPGTFLRESSPAETSLDPGRYWFWTLDPATGKASNRVLVPVAGQQEIQLDLQVP